MRHKLVRAFLILMVVFGVLFLLRVPIFHSLANFLIVEDKVEKVDAMVVLSGGAYDRGNEAVQVFRAGIASKVICPGGNDERVLTVYNMHFKESEVTRQNLLNQGIPDSAITLIKYGTSTKEEADTILGYCLQNNLHSILIVSSKFHLRRIKNVYVNRFAKAGIKVLLHGAKNSYFNEQNWYKEEDGLITLNNEYVKLLYYGLKY